MGLINNKFIKTMEIWSKFWKHKKINLFILIPRIMNLYIKYIPDIKRNKCKNIFWF